MFSWVLFASLSFGYSAFNSSWDKLPHAEEFREFYDYSLNLKPSLENGDVSTSQLEINKSGGTSVYFRVKHQGKYGAWLPPNSATNFRGEVFAFNLARLLEADPDLVGSAVEMPLTGKAIQWFERQLKTHRFRGRHKVQNQKKILKMLSRSKTLPGLYAMWGPKPRDFDEMVNYRRGGNGVLRTEHRIAKKLNCRNPRPKADRITVKRVSGAKTAMEIDLVKQLSTILLIDTLNLQWDRFSGGNLQVIKHPRTGDVAFVSHDNGGTQDRYKKGYLSHKYVKRIKSWVTRYDSHIAQRLQQVHDFLFAGGQLDNFANEEDLKLAMGVRSSKAWQRKWSAFKVVLKEMNAHIKAQGRNCLL